MSTLGKKMPNRKKPAPFKAKASHRNALPQDMTDHITVSMAPALRIALDARASRCNESRSAYVRRLVEADLRETGVEL